jgi:hypothetical protein
MSKETGSVSPPAFTLLFGVFFLTVSHSLGDISARAAGRFIIAPGRGFYIVLELPVLTAVLAYSLANWPGRRLDNPVMAALRDVLLFNLSRN